LAQEAQLALLRAHPGPMSGRKKTWADIMSDDDSDDGDFLEQRKRILGEDAAAVVMEDTYQGGPHPDAESSRLGLTADMDALECSSRMTDDSSLFTPYREKRQRSKGPEPPSGAPKVPKDSPKAKVPRTQEGPKGAAVPPASARPASAREESTRTTAPPSRAAVRAPVRGPATPAPWAKAAAPNREVTRAAPTPAPWAVADATQSAPAAEPSTEGAGEVPLESVPVVVEPAAAAAQAEAPAVDWQRRKEQRQKQINIGRATPGYIRYKELHPTPGLRDPLTPKADSRKDRKDWNFDLTVWRTFLHKFDPPEEAAGDA